VTVYCDGSDEMVAIADSSGNVVRICSLHARGGEGDSSRQLVGRLAETWGCEGVEGVADGPNRYEKFSQPLGVGFSAGSRTGFVLSKARLVRCARPAFGNKLLDDCSKGYIWTGFVPRNATKEEAERLRLTPLTDSINGLVPVAKDLKKWVDDMAEKVGHRSQGLDGTMNQKTVERFDLTISQLSGQVEFWRKHEEKAGGGLLKKLRARPFLNEAKLEHGHSVTPQQGQYQHPTYQQYSNLAPAIYEAAGCAQAILRTVFCLH
jgi:hypothetical protein